tara:strand:- start:76 stop:477 length:402 start_codon:yes stop_codon:yes gene_type:complete
MKLYPINCSCGSTRATELTSKLADCVVCGTAHDIQNVDYYTHEVTPLNDIMQQAKDQALKDMLDEWHLECHENNIKAELDSMYRRDLATQYGCALDDELITQKEHDDMIHSLNLEHNRFWATCFDVDNIRVAI